MSLQAKPSTFTSVPFKFIVEEQTFYIHGALVAAISKPLGRLISDPMSYKINGAAQIEDVTAATFTRFIEYVYKRKYTPADAKKPSESARKRARTEILNKPAICWAPIGGLSGDREEYIAGQRPNKSPRADVEYNFFWIESSDRPTRNLIKNQFDLIETSSETHTKKRRADVSGTYEIDYFSDHTEAFLSHAQVYVFAENFDIQDLRNYALYNLHTALKPFVLHPQRTGDIVALIRYVYTNTLELENGKDQLRSLITIYVGFQMDHLLENDEFRDLLNEGGAFLQDFLQVVTKRIR